MRRAELQKRFRAPRPRLSGDLLFARNRILIAAVGSAAYFAVFCAGVILVMAPMTVAISAPFVLAARRLPRLHEALVARSRMLSFGFGLFLAYQIVIVDRLFGSAPLWIPH